MGDPVLSEERERPISYADHAAWIRDLEDAAGECAVEMPQPGTPMARLLIANVLMRRELAALRGATPPAQNNGAHWDGCYAAAGHHICALAEIERLRSPGTKEAERRALIATERLKAARAALLAALRGATPEWRGIESAPKDGTRISVATTEHGGIVKETK